MKTQEQLDYEFFETILGDRGEALNLMLVLLGVKRGCLPSLSTKNPDFEARIESYRAPYDLLKIESSFGIYSYFIARPGAGPVYARDIYPEHGNIGRFLGYPVVYENLRQVSKRKVSRYEIRYVYITSCKEGPNQADTIFQFICGREDYNDVLLDQFVAWRQVMITILQEVGIFDPMNHRIELQLIFHPKEVDTPPHHPDGLQIFHPKEE